VLNALRDALVIAIPAPSAAAGQNFESARGLSGRGIAKFLEWAADLQC
jgi:hypothetical protein